MNRVAVESSNIAAVGWDPIGNTLEVEFHSGRIYQYSGVEKETHEDMMKSDSVGKFFNARIKPVYACTEVTVPDTVDDAETVEETAKTGKKVKVVGCVEAIQTKIQKLIETVGPIEIECTNGEFRLTYVVVEVFCDSSLEKCVDDGLESAKTLEG